MKTARICCIVLLAAGLAASGGSAPQAQEATSTTAPTPASAPTPAPATPAPATATPDDEAAFSSEPAAGERVSADNNISFPVDI